VLNFITVFYYSVDFYKEPDKKFAKIELQLYDRDSNSILVSKKLEGSDFPNAQFIFFSDGGTLSCAIKNALATCLGEINSQIFSQSHFLKEPVNVEHKSFELKLK
jgi:hypothetical protein